MLQPVFPEHTAHAQFDNVVVSLEQAHTLVQAYFRVNGINPTHISQIVHKYFGNTRCLISFHCNPEKTLHMCRRVVFNNKHNESNIMWRKLAKQRVNINSNSNCIGCNSISTPKIAEKHLLSIKLTNLDCTDQEFKYNGYGMQLGIFAIQTNLSNYDQLLEKLLSKNVEFNASTDEAIDDFFFKDELTSKFDYNSKETEAKRTIKARYLNLYFGNNNDYQVFSQFASIGIDREYDNQQIISNYQKWNANESKTAQNTQTCETSLDDKNETSTASSTDTDSESEEFQTKDAKEKKTSFDSSDRADASQAIAKQNGSDCCQKLSVDLNKFDLKYLLEIGDTIDMYIEKYQYLGCVESCNDANKCEPRTEYYFTLYKNGSTCMVGRNAGFQVKLDNFSNYDYYPSFVSRTCDCTGKLGFQFECYNDF